MKLRIFLIALLAITSISSAQIWGRKNTTPLGRDKQYNRAVDYNVVTADSVANRIGLFTVRGCPDVIYVPLRNPAAASDTVVFLQSLCVKTSWTESIWFAMCTEAEDSSWSVSADDMGLSWVQDTIFIDKVLTSSAGTDNVYLFRIR